MPYTKNSWVDNNGIFPLSATRMNHLETQYDSAMNDVAAGYAPLTSVTSTVKTFGAKGDGVTDDTAAFQAAANSLPNGGTISVPPAAYILNGTVTVPAGVKFQGTTRYASTILFGSATGIGFKLNAACGISDMQLAAASGVTRTADPFVQIVGNSVTISSCDFNGYFKAIDVATASTDAEIVSPRILNCGFSNMVTSSSGGAIDMKSYASAVIEGVIISGTRGAAQSGYGIKLEHGDTIVVANTNVTATGRALYIIPTGNQAVVAAQFINSLFDSAYGSGLPCVDINANSGFIYNAIFSNCWFGLSNSGNGCTVQTVGTGVVDNLQFTGCDFPSNGAAGLNLLTTQVKNVNVVGCTANSNQNYGISVQTGVSGFVISGCKAGNAAAGAYTQSIGINLDASAHTNYVIQGCNLNGNGSAGLYDGSTGTPNKAVGNNIS